MSPPLPLTPDNGLPTRANRRVNEETNMTLLFDKQDTEDSEDDNYSFEVPSLFAGSNDYHAFSDNTTYHPTSVEGINPDTTVLSNDLTSLDSISTEEALYTASAFSKQKSLPHALGPPSHNLKARRSSKIVDVGSVPMNRKQSIVKDYKEMTTHSAVSPRFMTLRKLSEVTALPPQGLFVEPSVPPVPRLPSSHLTPSSSPPLLPSKGSDLSGIDSIIEAQLQYHLGQMSWRVSESHVEARRFWEEQKNQVFGFASLMVDRIEREMQTKLENTIQGMRNTLDLQQELRWHKHQLVDKQSQLQELEALQIRNSELEKQHAINMSIIHHQQLDRERLERRLAKYEISTESSAKSKSLLPPEKNPKRKIPSSMGVHEEVITWAEIMETEDEKVDSWKEKYKELEKRHRAQSDQTQALYQERMQQAKETEIALRTQLESVQLDLKKSHRTHCACCKFHKSPRPTSSQPRAQSFIAQDGYLTFTAEINGQLSKYSVKIPKEQSNRASLDPNAPIWKKT
ncbi:hypothetical protein BY458DRAFT_521255 [Sporodiniella umbellata]|nr:hypothetical protein BY458DRAFT_521255 [Sporodiniella umbellata]